MKKPFTLFLILLIIMFLLSWPYYMYLHETGKIDFSPIEEEDYRGIITFWDFPHQSSDDPTGYNFIKKKIQDFEYYHPGVIIEFEPLKNSDGYERVSDIGSDNKPDIVPITSDSPLIYDGKLEPLNKYIDRNYKDSLKEQVLDSFTYKGSIYGLPLGMYSSVMFINKDLFSEKEIEVPQDGEWTYDEFLEDMTKLTYQMGKKEKKSYYGLSMYIEGSYNLWGILMSDGANIVNDKGLVSFEGPQAESGLKKLIELSEKGVIDPVSYGDDYNKVWDSFTVLKESAVLIDESYKIQYLKYLQNKNKLFDFDVALYPEGDSDVPLTLSPKVYGYGVTKQIDKKKLEMAYKFIKFITDSQESVEKIGYIPVKKSIALNDELMKKIDKAVKYTDYPPPNWHDKNVKINKAIIDGLINKENEKRILIRMQKIIN
ncbi:ABC transporter substrate-binding protein [Thermoanaerobacterium thermosaccharolyticum]|uniref:ABC transporter substrate-binding protein n=1 Tax=Thermoanaerobacterium thermosaccharolyticum TaxID=1517 RepID=UPI000C069B01|nr:extracellular solute-binding protein [Thermoanaerobacterium thermosaccharolyticum]KAA5808405.1 extracellular solute-binding protein [Thermoanaerobacterium thermosaccharolyticum]PHO06099.1 sugar ABC transporter substrate-binding protein [Thermoanaerobacterium thermosaccharolyticum]TCW34595.1 carbohydrate ABC transporter substrate-binding protein (CUT1 family) [Thermohydrogenium kirishiense]